MTVVKIEIGYDIHSYIIRCVCPVINFFEADESIVHTNIGVYVTGVHIVIGWLLNDVTIGQVDIRFAYNVG